jgi:hypothetical protein
MTTIIDSQKLQIDALDSDPTAPTVGTAIVYNRQDELWMRSTAGIKVLSRPPYRHIAFRPQYNLVADDIEWTTVYSDLPTQPAVQGAAATDEFTLTIDAAPGKVWASATDGITVDVSSGGLGTLIHFDTNGGNLSVGTLPNCEIRVYD